MPYGQNTTRGRDMLRQKMKEDKDGMKSLIETNGFIQHTEMTPPILKLEASYSNAGLTPSMLYAFKK